MRRAVLMMGLIVIAAGCSLYSTSSRTAKDIKSVAVSFFDNRTPEPDLEIRMTEQIIDNLLEDNTLKVVSESEADAILEGAIVSFENAPFSFNAELNAEEYQVRVTVNVSLFKRAQNEPIFESKTIRGDGSYFVNNPQDDFTFEDALSEAIDEITERILNLTVQDW